MATQIDTRVPEQFRTALLEREKQAAAEGDPKATVTPALDPSQDPAAAPGSAPPAAEEGAQEGSEPDAKEGAVAVEGTPAQVAAPDPAAAAAVSSDTDPAWDPKFLVDPEMSKEKRWKVVSGMVSKEARKRIDAEGRVAELERQVEELKTSRPVAAPVGAGAPPASNGAEKAERMKALQEKLAGGAGDYHKDIVELIELMGFVKASDLDPVRKQVEDVRGEVGKVQKTFQATTRDAFLSDLKDLAPDWEAKNITPGFKNFLKTRVPGTLFTYEDAALKANAEGDPMALAEVFNLFPLGTAPAASTTSSKKPPSKFASPPRTAAAAPAQKPETAKETVKESDYIKFTADVQNGKFQSMDPVKSVELQAKMLAEKARFQTARSEGRMIFNQA